MYKRTAAHKNTSYFLNVRTKMVTDESHLGTSVWIQTSGSFSSETPGDNSVRAFIVLQKHFSTLRVTEWECWIILSTAPFILGSVAALTVPGLITMNNTAYCAEVQPCLYRH